MPFSVFTIPSVFYIKESAPTKVLFPTENTAPGQPRH